jgi:hypothetical protein
VTIVEERPEPSARTRRRPGPISGTVGVLAVGVLVLAWWAWPTWSGADDRLDVLVVGDELLTASQRSIELRVREEGMTVDWSEAADDWCDDPRALAEDVSRRGPRNVVVSFARGADDPTCITGALDALGDRDVVVVWQPGAPRAPEPLEDTDVLDPTRLLGEPSVSELGCQWWETCETGSVQVRDDAGRLTEAGSERLARMIAASLRG